MFASRHVMSLLLLLKVIVMAIDFLFQNGGISQWTSFGANNRMYFDLIS